MQQGRNDNRSRNIILGPRFRGLYRNFAQTIRLPSLATFRACFRLLVIIVGLFLIVHLFDVTISQLSPMWHDGKAPSSPQEKFQVVAQKSENTTVSLDVAPENMDKKMKMSHKCSLGKDALTCPKNRYPNRFNIHEHISVPAYTCPDFFRWIHEDLRPWAETGITKEMVERAKRSAAFRFVILNGRAYVEKYKKPTIQTRDVFTIWGLIQLLRRYPGKVPDLDLMFDCSDQPLILKNDYHHSNSLIPPPLFGYCGDDDYLDIVFPDWSFWGWAENNVKPWDSLLKDFDAGNKKIKWIHREPYAYWKGNPYVAKHRQDLLECNVSETRDWNARLYVEDRIQESHQEFEKSNLATQCTHRFKIYIEGSAWSVSDKYTLACDSATLMVKRSYYDFFTRGLMPFHHYWPVTMDDTCRSIKFAVDWGNNHNQWAQRIGKAASKFTQEDMKMDNVYDYMFHLLNGYSKLMKYKPTVPKNAVEICSEAMICTSRGISKQFMEESTVRGPSYASPCIMQPPYDPQTLNAILNTKTKSIKQFEKWENIV